MLQQFARGRPASRPSTNARARRRGSTLRKRAPIRSISSSSMPSQRPGSTLWPAATARSSRFVTNRDDQTVAVSHPAPTRRKITIYCWSTRLDLVAVGGQLNISGSDTSLSVTRTAKYQCRECRGQNDDKILCRQVVSVATHGG